MQESKRVMTVHEQGLRDTVLDSSNGLAELGLLLRGIEIVYHSRWRPDLLSDPNNLVDNLVFLVLHDPTVIREGRNPEPLVLRPAAFQVVLPLAPKNGNYPSRCGGPKGGNFTKFEHFPIGPLVIQQGPQSIYLGLPLAVATYICDEVLRDLASFKVINIRRFEESDAFAGLGGAVELNEGQVEVPAVGTARHYLCQPLDRRRSSWRNLFEELLDRNPGGSLLLQRLFGRVRSISLAVSW
jgi:hypothetical protein